MIGRKISEKPVAHFPLTSILSRIHLPISLYTPGNINILQGSGLLNRRHAFVCWSMGKVLELFVLLRPFLFLAESIM